MDTDVAINVIDRECDVLKHVSDELWKHPELLFQEHKAHSLLTGTLEKYGFSVQRSYYLPTAFRAEFSNGEGPVVCFICEYDALPEIGHACGHNLIAECGLGAALGYKAALEKGLVKGKVVCMGTPAEEGGGGKVILITKNAFKDIDICLMAHPGPYDQCFPLFLAIERITIKYFGKASHASACPWGGINALDAAVACYSNISMLRQQMKPNWRIHGVIKNGGTVPNVIPAETELLFYMRAPLMSELKILKEKAFSCIESAAKATGCTFEIISNDDSYKNLVTNKKMASIFRKYADKLGNINFTDGDDSKLFIASTDMGNVSHEVPSIHPMFHMGTFAANHTLDFTTAGGKQEAQPYTILVAKSMVLTAIEIALDPKLLDEIKDEFKSANK